jgi:hypothetical protein
MQSMSQPAKVREPSMEEILASIRRIITDDDAVKAPPDSLSSASLAALALPHQSTETVKPNRMPMTPSAKPSPSLARAPSAPASDPAPSAYAANAVRSHDDTDTQFATLDEPQSPDPERASPLSSSRETHKAPPPRPADMLEPTEEMRTPSSQPTFRKAHAEPGSDRPATEPPRLMSSSTEATVESAFNALAQTVIVQNARTLDDLVREMLRPMLKAWLDENLPHMVERLVRAEIERISGGR